MLVSLDMKGIAMQDVSQSAKLIGMGETSETYCQIRL